MFFSPAHAQSPAAADPSGGLFMIVPYVAIFVIFYFLLIRPQQAARKKHLEMITNVRRGDQVVTAGGIIGKVTKILEGDEIQVQIADNVTVKVLKSTLSTVLTKSEPAANDQ